MKIYDISMSISKDMMVYKNQESKKPKIFQSASFEKNDHYETEITINMHTGTHIDAPLHMLKDGLPMSVYSIKDYISEAKVLDLTHLKNKITKADLEDFDIQKDDFILFKTRNSFSEIFEKDFVFLEKSGADYLCKIGIKGIGIDALGIERSQPEHDTHKVLFENSIMIVEGIILKDVPEGNYQLIILPLKILETEAAPARAILMGA